jgi:hypothetical protein
MSALRIFRQTVASLACAIACTACRSSATPPAVSATPASAGDNTGLYGTYDNNNPFAKILRGELPVSKVYATASIQELKGSELQSSELQQPQKVVLRECIL